MEPRGIRNCNPLNIRRVAGTHWKGQCARQTDPEFVRFESIPWGIRTAFCLLRTYRDKYRLNCITDIITRWAPPSGNHTERYIRNVCQWTGFGGMQRLTEREWPALVRAMARQESGSLLSEALIQEGFDLYRTIDNSQLTIHN